MSEMIFTHGLLDPATFDVLWTMAVSALLLLAGTLSVWILPWSDTEIDAVHSSFSQVITQNIRPLAAPRTASQPTH